MPCVSAIVSVLTATPMVCEQWLMSLCTGLLSDEDTDDSSIYSAAAEAAAVTYTVALSCHPNCRCQPRPGNLPAPTIMVFLIGIPTQYSNAL